MECLFVSDPETTKRLCPSPVERTCTWILNNKVLRRWLSWGGNNILWLSGRAGCVKTVISSFLIDTLKSEASKVLFFFSDDKDVRRSDALALIRGILHQLFESYHDLVKHAIRYYETRGESILDITTLLGTCEDCFNDLGTRRIICVPDGLDECEASGRDQLLRWIRNYMLSSPRDNIRFLLTSRPETGIKDIIDDGDSESRLDLDQLSSLVHSENGMPVIDPLEQDIVRFIEHEVWNMPALKTWPIFMKRQLQSRLTENANKTFLWASLVLQMLSDVPDASIKSFEALLNQIPDKLQEVYREMRDRIPESNRPKTIDLLNVLVAVREPLSLRELNECVAINPNVKKAKELDLWVDERRSVRKLCGHFVRIIGDHCHLVHQSAKEYLLAHHDKNSEQSTRKRQWLQMSLANAHRFMAERCMLYMCLADFNNYSLSPDLAYFSQGETNRRVRRPGNLREAVRERYTKHHFLYYALHQWAYHFRQVEINGPLKMSVGLVELAELLHQKQAVRAHWFLKMIRLTQEHLDLTEAGYSIHPMVFCAYNGHVSVARKLLDQGLTVDVPIAILKLSSLHAAVLGRQLNMVSWLIAQGADVDTVDAWGRTPLHLAARRNGTEILRLLLQYGASTTVEDNFGMTPLQNAEMGGLQDHIWLLRGYGKLKISPIQYYVRSVLQSPYLKEPLCVMQSHQVLAEGFTRVHDIERKMNVLWRIGPFRLKCGDTSTASTRNSTWEEIVHWQSLSRSLHTRKRARNIMHRATTRNLQHNDQIVHQANETTKSKTAVGYGIVSSPRQAYWRRVFQGYQPLEHIIDSNDPQLQNTGPRLATASLPARPHQGTNVQDSPKALREHGGDRGRSKLTCKRGFDSFRGSDSSDSSDERRSASMGSYSSSSSTGNYRMFSPFLGLHGPYIPRQNST